MGIFSSMDVSASGMTAQRIQMDIIAQNIANVHTSRTISGEPYRRHVAIITPAYEQEFIIPVGFFDDEPQNLGSGVVVSEILEDPAPLKKVYNPTHPDADEKGYINMPNVDIITEMTNMIMASRAFEANAAALEAAKNMAMKALEMMKG